MNVRLSSTVNAPPTRRSFSQTIYLGPRSLFPSSSVTSFTSTLLCARRRDCLKASDRRGTTGWRLPSASSSTTCESVPSRFAAYQSSPSRFSARPSSVSRTLESRPSTALWVAPSCELKAELIPRLSISSNASPCQLPVWLRERESKLTSWPSGSSLPSPLLSSRSWDVRENVTSSDSPLTSSAIQGRWSPSSRCARSL